MAATGESRWPSSCCCRLPPGVGLCWFRGRGFCSPNDRRLGEAVGSSRLARRGCTAVPGCETTPAWTCQARTSLLLAVVN